MRGIRVILSGSLLLALVMIAMPPRSFAQVAVSITIGPPALPVYEQPFCPGPGYLWTPGYWAWGPDGYFWVPGTWVVAPVGLLWTPGYWAWDDEDGVFVWIPGYWGRTVGFYGGIFYGFGYGGVGYEGGYWNNEAFYYNRSVNNITNVTNITNFYNKTVVNNVIVNNVSYNGGAGGTTAQPTAVERAAAREPHTPPTAEQTRHHEAASTNRALLASVNQGKPPVAATSKPGVLSGQGVVAARAAAAYHPTPNPAALQPSKHATPPSGTTVRPNEPPDAGARSAQPLKPKPPEAQRPTYQPGKPANEPETKPEKNKPEKPPKEQGKEKQERDEKEKPNEPPQR